MKNRLIFGSQIKVAGLFIGFYSGYLSTVNLMMTDWIRLMPIYLYRKFKIFTLTTAFHDKNKRKTVFFEE